MDGSGKRFNAGKTRFDLVPAYAQEQYAKVLTKGAEKYGDDNWRRGMKWSNVLSSLERHLNAIKIGKDYDEETGLLHSAHIMANAGFLTEYYKIYPEGDNRPHHYTVQKKIAINIIDILADYTTHYSAYFNDTKAPDQLQDQNFWESMPVKLFPNEIPFQPHCYIIDNSTPIQYIKDWLIDNEFPDAPIYHMDTDSRILNAHIITGAELFIEYRITNFIKYNSNHILCYLYDTLYNRRCNVGYKRIYKLTDVLN